MTGPCPAAHTHTSRRGPAVTRAVVSLGRIAGAWLACSCRLGRLARRPGRQDGGGWAGAGRGGACILVKLCFQAVWLGRPGWQRCNTTTNTTVCLWCLRCGGHCRRLPDRLASGVCAEVARSQTLQAGTAGTAGTAGRAYLLGNLRTLATACQANFSRHLVLRLGPQT